MSFPYVTLSESARRKADLHAARASRYLLIGNIGYALGSIRKMLKQDAAAAQLASFNVLRASITEFMKP
jgi:hypothetical protein